jgi:hypothetical protein
VGEETRKAMGLFLDRIKAIQDVRAIHPISLGRVRVSISDRHSASGRAVREIEYQIREDHPSAILDVWLSEAH